MSTFVRNFLLAQWTTTVVCIAPGLKMAQMFKLWRLHNMFCTCTALDKKKEPSWWCTKWYRRICSLILPRCIEAWSRGSCKSGSLTIPQLNQALWFLDITRFWFYASAGWFFFFVKGNRWSVFRFCGRKFCQWSYICEVVLPSTVQSLFSLLSRNMGWKVKQKKKKKKKGSIAYVESRELRGLTPCCGCLDLIINNNGSCSFPTNTKPEKFFTISCRCCLCLVSDVMLACLHNMAVTVSPLRHFIFYVLSNTLSEHLSSFLVSLCFLFIACIARKITSSYTNFRRWQKMSPRRG